MRDNVTLSQLSATQRAMVGAKLATLKNGSNQHTQKEGSPKGPASLTEDASSLLNVGTSSVKRAKQVLESKSKPLIETQGDPWAYVWSSMMRKNHSESQLSIYAAEWQGVVGPKKRGPKKKGKANSGNGAGNTNGDTRDEAAEKFGIGGRTVSKAVNVLEKGYKQLQQAKPQKRSHRMRSNELRHFKGCSDTLV